MLILGIILFGMLAGWIAQLSMGRRGQQIDWAMALIAGLVVLPWAAPGVLSTITWLFMLSPIFCARMRAVTSTDPPAG